jgi:hypothetical protein
MEAALPPGKEHLYPLDERGWVDPRAGLDEVMKRKFLTLPGLELRTLGRPARSQSLYRLRYPASWTTRRLEKNVFSRFKGLCVTYRRVLDRIIGFIDTLYIYLGITCNTELSLLNTSPLHMH